MTAPDARSSSRQPDANGHDTPREPFGRGDQPAQPAGCCQEHCTVGYDGMYGDEHCDAHCTAAKGDERAVDGGVA